MEKLKKIIKVLKIILRKLKNKKIKWVVVGSTSLALQGVKISPKDIDILTNKEGAFRMNEIFKDYRVKPVRFSQRKFFSSYFGRFKIEGVRVDIMGNLKARIGQKWVPLTKRLYSHTFVKLGKEKIPVPFLEDQLEVYKKVKRKKNIERVKKIEEFLKKKRF
jgi:predicted nucleotidyltransferase